MERRFGTIASLLGFLAVACGAFGAHALKARVTPERLAVFDVGVRYHLHHALALLVVAKLQHQRPSKKVAAAGWFFVVGILLFSGSLYTLVLTDQRYWGAVTPLGGVAFLIGWLLLASEAWQTGSKP
jgi:uncharacterized membrane protein YgdD (TMEM256/DUF423 family)